MRSSSFCSFWNSGAALFMMNSASTNTMTMTASRIMPSSQSSRMASTSATIKIKGTGSTIWIKLVSAVWMLVMSDTVRVVMEAMPKCLKSYLDSLRDLSYSATRMSLPMRAVRVAQA